MIKGFVGEDKGGCGWHIHRARKMNGGILDRGREGSKIITGLSKDPLSDGNDSGWMNQSCRLHRHKTLPGGNGLFWRGSK